jgi:hypothetical protein
MAELYFPKTAKPLLRGFVTLQSRKKSGKAHALPLIYHLLARLTLLHECVLGSAGQRLAILVDCLAGTLLAKLLTFALFHESVLRSTSQRLALLADGLGFAARWFGHGKAGGKQVSQGKKDDFLHLNLL